MATTAIHAPAHAAEYPGEHTGLWSWLTTVDHKRIGVLYLYTALGFFVFGGIEAVIIRAQLGAPNQHLVSAEFYNQLFTMHGTTMIFLAIMPLSAAFFNFLIPLQLGARDVAFPRLNAFSYWVYLFGGLFITIPIFFAVAPNGGSMTTSRIVRVLRAASSRSAARLGARARRPSPPTSATCICSVASRCRNSAFA